MSRARKADVDSGREFDHIASARQWSLRWIKLRDLVPSPKAQRRFSAGRARYYASRLDLDKIGFPLVNVRGGVHYVFDGQHRIAALKFFGFGPDDTVQCKCFVDLTEEQEADMFLGTNDSRPVDALSKFRVGVHAGYRDETAIDQVVRHLGMHVGQRRRNGNDPAISAVGVLRDVYARLGDVGLAKTLRVVRDAFGAAGLDGPVIDGLSLCVQRYDGTIDEDAMVAALANTAGGLNGLLNQAEKTRLAVGQNKAQCVAATAVEIYNRAHRGKTKLAPWWREADPMAERGVA